MALVTSFGPPAGWRDFPDGPDGDAFRKNWHVRVSDLVNGLVTSGRGKLFDPRRYDATVVAVRQLSWMGFPRALHTVTERDDRAEAFRLAEDRQSQAEYFEWHTTTENGKVTKVTFSVETPEYWTVLAETDPDRLLQLYRRLVDDDVQRADLFTDGVYDPQNKWNTERGIVHFACQSPQNSLSAVLGLVGAGAGQTEARDNFAGRFAGETSADDYVVLEVAALLRKRGHFVTVADPVGFHIDGWDDTGWTAPDGSPVDDNWRITRGRPGAALRLEYEVRSGAYTVGDIRIGGRPVTHGGQLAEHVSVSLPVVVAKDLT